jgi:hypothetical protein
LGLDAGFAEETFGFCEALGGGLGLFFELAGDIGPDVIAGLVDGFEEAAGLFADGFQVANEGEAVGIRGKEFFEARVFADGTAASLEELGEVLLELGYGHVVQIFGGKFFHRETSREPSGLAPSTGSRF